MIRKILHTSDWHLGRRLKERERTKEFAAFFDWLEKVIITENIDLLLVAGDIFDGTTPSIAAQEMYYSFLSRLNNTNCRHIVIISGNHDSPAFLDAPSELLKLCKIHVIGQVRENLADEVITLTDSDGSPEAIICAVPFLRNKDVMRADVNDNFSEIEQAAKAGIAEHYSKVFQHAKELQGDSNIPVIAMGHLFVQGGQTHFDDGVRSLYVGTAIQIAHDIFPEWLAYTALGHLHSPQKAGRENIRYSGSPIPMGFGESGQKKSAYILELDGKNLTAINEINIPSSQRLELVKGNFEQIMRRLSELAKQNESIWAEVIYTGNEPISNLSNELNDYVKNFPLLEILSVQDKHTDIYSPEPATTPTLDKISPDEIFSQLMERKKVSEEDIKIYRTMYHEILHNIDMGELLK